MNNNLIAERGDTLTLKLEFTDDYNPVNITGWKVYFTVKSKEDDPDTSAIIQKDVTSHTDPVNGKTSVVVPNTETNTLLGEYFYDIQFKDTANNIKTPMSGLITFVRDITRRTT